MGKPKYFWRAYRLGIGVGGGGGVASSSPSRRRRPSASRDGREQYTHIRRTAPPRPPHPTRLANIMHKSLRSRDFAVGAPRCWIMDTCQQHTVPHKKAQQL